MKPICFACEATLPLTPDEILRQILDVSNWTEFQGYGVLPGIKQAEFAVRTPEIVGSKIKVTNSDGSSHVEEIVEWHPDRRLTLQFQEFSPPVSRLAKRFDEIWDFERLSTGTRVVRSFELYAKSALTWPVLWAISILLKRAVARHLRQMRDRAPT